MKFELLIGPSLALKTQLIPLLLGSPPYDQWNHLPNFMKPTSLHLSPLGRQHLSNSMRLHPIDPNKANDICQSPEAHVQ